MSLLKYFNENISEILGLLFDHIGMTFLAVGIAILIGVPLGILISYSSKSSKTVLGIANVVQAIPSMALLGFLIPLTGIGVVPAIVAVVLYSLLPIIKNTYTGISNINEQTIEAAKGIGLNKFQILYKIQLPLALPVIMSGVRIASVTAVGLMTMAAYIGAGGLGYLVFSGIRTMNTSQILAGAIPACLLALFVDFILGRVEKIVVPANVIKIKKQKNKKTSIILSSIALVLILFVTIFSLTRNPKDKDGITIGTKDFTEQIVLGNILAELIEDRTDIKVNREFNLGGTQICFGALKKGDIDIYIDYSGTAYSDTLKYDPISDVELIYNTVKNDFKRIYGIDVLTQMGFNNTYALAVTKETAEKYNLKTISDFSKVASNLTSGTTFEFANRDDGIKGLEKYYNFSLKNKLAIDSSPRYTALLNKEVDVIDAFTTDGLLKKHDLVILEDDKSFFPPYYAIPLMKEKSLEKFPEVKELLDELAPLLTNTVMMELNYKVDELDMKPLDVAKEFLLENNLIGIQS